MLEMRRTGVAAAVLTAGVLLMGADPAPAPSTPEATASAMGERLAKVLPTPRLYEIHTTRDGKADPTSQFCLGAEPMLKMLQAFQAQAGDFKPLSQGCTHKREPRTDGGLQIEIGCDKAAGASFTSRLIMEADGQLKEIHQRMELQWEVEHSTRSTVAETRFV